MAKPMVFKELRRIGAERDERARKWLAHEYVDAAYRAADMLEERVAAPERYPERYPGGWRDHIELTVRDAAMPGDARDAAAIVAAVEPDIRKMVETLNGPTPFEQLQRARTAISAMRWPGGSYGDSLPDPSALAKPLVPSPSADLTAAIEQQNRRKREREEAQDSREARMVEALTALVAYGDAETAQGEERERREQAREIAQEAREQAQEARERLMVRWTIAGVCVGVLAVVAAAVTALAS